MFLVDGQLDRPGLFPACGFAMSKKQSAVKPTLWGRQRRVGKEEDLVGKILICVPLCLVWDMAR